MITLRRADSRRHHQTLDMETWLSFFEGEGGSDPLAHGFGCIEAFNEVRLQPGAPVPQYRSHDSEIITFLRDGSLAHQDSTGGSSVVEAGEFQRMTAGRGVRHTETNLSQSDPAHLFQIWVRPSEVELPSGLEQRRFSAAERRDRLCVIGSPDGRKRSLRIHQDLLMYSAILQPGYHLIHELLGRRSAWLHIVEGAVCFGGDIVLMSGDGVGIADEIAVSFTAREQSEILLFDLPSTQS